MAALHTQSADNIIDYRPCQSASDYGWPRFDRVQALTASPWADYLQEMYGTLPDEFPFCTFDLWFSTVAR